MTTQKTAGERAWALAAEKIDAFETALAAARHLQARAVVTMRAEGLRWAQIEEITGRSRQRLNVIVRDYGD